MLLQGSSSLTDGDCVIDDDLRDFVKGSNVRISTSISSPPPLVECNAFFFSEVFKQSESDSTHSGTKTTEAGQLFLLFLPFIFLLRHGYVRGVTFSQINLDVLEARFTCI